MMMATTRKSQKTTAAPAVGLVAGLLLLALLLPCAAQAARFERTIKDIRLFGKGERIEVEFSHTFQGTPVQRHGKGKFSLDFSATGSDKPARQLRPVEDSLFSGISVVQNRFSTTVTFTFRDPALDLENRLGFVHKDNIFQIQVDAPAQAAAPPPPTTAQNEAANADQLLKQMGERIAGTEVNPQQAEAPALPPLVKGDLIAPDFIRSMVVMVVALVFIVAGLYGVLWLYNRFFNSRLRKFAGGQAIRQVASFHIGPRQRIVVLEINGEMVACGVTPNQITYITHLGGTGPQQGGMDGGLDGGLVAGLGGGSDPNLGGGPAGGTPAGGRTAKGPRSAGGKAGTPKGGAGQDTAPAADPVQQFAETLKQKVRSLKRIN